MSFSSLRLLSVFALAALAGCTSGPLYAPSGIDPVTGRAETSLSELSGRIAVIEPSTRTDQIVRNALLFRLNGAAAISDPLYEVTLVTTAVDQGVSVQSGTGVPTASVYRLQVNYAMRRLSDGATIATGSRFSTAPYDRSEQLFASQRAIIDAREKAGAEVADRVTAALLPILRRGPTAAPVAGAGAPAAPVAPVVRDPRRPFATGNSQMR